MKSQAMSVRILQKLLMWKHLIFCWLAQVLPGATCQTTLPPINIAMRRTGYLQAEKWFLPTELLKDKTKTFIEQSHCPVGIFVNRDFVKASKIVLILDSEADLFLLPYAQTLMISTQGYISIIYRSSEYRQIEKPLRQFLATVKSSTLLPDTDISGTLLNKYNFMLISYATWNDVSEHRKAALQEMPSTLILGAKG